MAIQTNLFGSGPGSGATVGNVAGAASDLFGAAGSVLGGLTAAAGSAAAAKQYGNAATITKEQTALSEFATQRQVYQTLGQEQAAVASNGFQLGGSAGDILRSSAAQGALAKGTISLQGSAQEQSYSAQQKAAKSAASGQLWGGIISGLADVAGVVAAPFTGGASLVAAGAVNAAISANGGRV